MTNSNDTSLTLKELAEAAGVSIATASRFLNGKITNKNAAHLKLEKLVKEKGFVKQRRKATPRLLLVMSKLSRASDDDFETRLCRHLEEACREQNIELVITKLLERDHIRDEAEKRARELGCSGVFIHANLPDDNFQLPFIVIDDDHYYGSQSNVSCDNSAGLVMGFRRLKDLGHETIAYFSDYPAEALRTDPRDHFIEQAYRINNLKLQKELVFHGSFPPFQHGPVVREAVERFLSISPRPTAIFLKGDCYAPAFYDELSRHGLSVPADMSILGFDGSGLCSLLSPTLATVAKPFAEMARAAVKLMDQKLARPDMAPQTILVRPEIVSGDSLRKR